MAKKERVPAKTKKPIKARAPKAMTADTKENAELESSEELETVEEVESLQAESQEVVTEKTDTPKQPEAKVPGTQEPKDRPAAPRTNPSDEYTLQTYFDRGTKQFVATVVEFPELRVTGTNRLIAVSELEEKIEELLYELKTRGQFIAEPIQARVYPERLDVAVSQSLYRKLDLISRQEKLPIDRLVAEMLTAALGKRQDAHRPQQNRPPQHQQHQGGGQNQGNQQQNRHQQNRHQGGQPRHQQGRGGGPRDIDNRENFMEYVRNLEKGGGTGGWKKR